MPAHDYECHDCALVFEAKVSWDGPHPDCPYCGSSNVSRRPPLISVQFKGEGWTPKHYGGKDE